MRLEGLKRAGWARERCTGGSKRTGALQAIEDLWIRSVCDGQPAKESARVTWRSTFGKNRWSAARGEETPVAPGQYREAG